MRSVGMSVSSAVAGTIMAQLTTSIAGYALPAQNGFRAVFGISAGAAMLAMAVAVFIPVHQTMRRGKRMPDIVRRDS